MILVIVGIAAGLLVSDAVMNGLSAGAVGIVVATVVIWIIHGVLAIWWRLQCFSTATPRFSPG